jgi:uncharacterized protein YabE (DUF348 family)/3D (Asp-Asp-Asp) domain-containing protein
VLSFAVFPARRLAITADGRSVTVVSRQDDAHSLLNMAGVQPNEGDVVVQQGSTLMLDRAIPVLVEVDGQTLGWRTRARSIENLLSEMDVTVSPYDAIRYNGIEVRPEEALVPEETISLNIKRAVPVSINEDGRLLVLQSSRDDLAAVLADAGIELGPADEVFPEPTSPVVSGMQVQVKHAKAINLRTGSNVRTIYTQKPTLREALAEIGITVGEDDRVEPDADAAVSNNMTARLVRVTGQTLYEREPVRRKTVLKLDDSMSGYHTRRVEGRDGVRVDEYRIVIEDGVESEKTFVKSFFEPEVADNVVYFSPDAAENVGFVPGLTIVESRRVYATWYNPASAGKPRSDASYNVTRTGTDVQRGTIAVDPNVIPLGTRLFVPGYGFGIAADTGGGIIGDWIDLGYPDGVPVDWHTGWVEIFILR